MSQKPVIQNRKARFRYELLDCVECGIILIGAEVKSLRDGQGSLAEAFATINDNEVWLHGFHIPAYGHSESHPPVRPRKLLLHKHEIARLAPKLAMRGLTLIPIQVYFNDHGIAKVSVALAKGKTHRDKRQDMKERDDKREIDRALRRR